jgi:hypothetical protein
MMNILRIAVATCFLLLESSNCFAQMGDFAGTYHCYGFDPYLNKKYTGSIVITPQNTVYSLKMKYDTGEEAVGTAGLYDEDTISVVFQDTKDLKKVGLERYSYSSDHKRIQGYWVYLGQDKLGKEVCEKVKE